MVEFGNDIYTETDIAYLFLIVNKVDKHFDIFKYEDIIHN